ncbi:MAG: PilZ domain-containing protein [Lachnospiraceae bacterium]|nr:PilZ domain-containing protein [Lachnospiraceae bacterium]
MSDRRRKERTQLDVKIKIKRMNSDEFEVVDVQVTNVSVTGLGFNCPEILEKGAVYEASLVIWTKEVLPVYLEIVRVEMQDEDFNYGAVFIGMTETVANRIELYQTIEKVKKETKDQF